MRKNFQNEMNNSGNYIGILFFYLLLIHHKHIITFIWIKYFHGKCFAELNSLNYHIMNSVK